MGDLRSYSHGDRRMDMEVYGRTRAPFPSSSSYDLHDLRCYSASYSSSQVNGHVPKQFKLEKGKSFSSSSKSGWILSDPELQRKKRVAGYKAYAVEGKVKGSFRKSFRWIKDKYTQVVYGWW